MRSISKVSISYGLHNIPVKVCTVVRDSGTGMSNCCPDCNGDVGHKNACKNCSKELNTKDILKAYKVGEEKHIFTQDELTSLKNVEKSIDVAGITNIDAIDPRYITGSYYLVPEVAKKAYAILLQGMEKSGKAIVVKFALRGKQRLGVLVPQMIQDQGIILMRTLAFSTQVQSIDEELRYDLTEVESDMGVSFINSLKEIDPTTIENQYAKQMEEILSGEMITVPTAKKQVDETAFFAV
jgi:DNA end-binding protein Ku